ncbi:MAG: hypothetical protein IH604_09040 [Burkholderiales bacterium]|nr:hypothetical protein [Burkholderiales bacterium]
MTDRQDALLAKHDGRYFSIGKFNTGLAMLTKAEKLGKKGHVDFGLPSSPALFLNLARRSYVRIKDNDPAAMFYKWQNSHVPVNSSCLFDYFELFISHVVFSFSALEAFANEAIPKEFEYERNEGDQIKVIGKVEIERSVNLDEKLHVVLPRALDVKSPKGRKPWQRYKQLKTMRDRIIHLKTIDRSASDSNSESVWGLMLRSHGEPFCDYAHTLMGHYTPTKNRRWFHEYPYKTIEPDRLFSE